MVRRAARRHAAILCVLGALLTGCAGAPPAPTPHASPGPVTVNWPRTIVPPVPAPARPPGFTTRSKKGTPVAIGRDYLVTADLTGDAESDPPVFLALYSQSLSSGEVRRLNFWGDWRVTDISDDGVGTEVVVAARFDGQKSAVDVVPLDGSLAYPRLEVAGLRTVSVRGTLATYVVSGEENPLAGPSGPLECTRSFAERVWGPPYCKPVS